MLAPQSCAKPCLVRSLRDIAVASALVAASACGGAVSSELTADAGDAGADAGADVGADAAPSCGSAVSGAACKTEGETCSSGCSDPCQFCNVLRCTNGRWENLEVPPEPCVDASARRHPDARMSWQGPGGIAGTGPALVVDGSGSIRVWQSVQGFDPTGAPPSPPDATFTESGAAIDALFDAWLATSTTGLPHAGSSAECGAIVYVTICAHCGPSVVKYSDASQVSPEMNGVWSWFDANLPAMPIAAHPRRYCSFM